MTKIVLLGPDGQVGWELQRSLAPLGALNAVHRTQVDFDRLEELATFLHQEAPDIIVNAAAYTAVDRAESEPEAAMRINAQAVGVLAEKAQRSGALLVHYSTDYVFDGGKPEPYTEDDAPNPVNVYGRTKSEGERLIRASGCRHLVFRTSWVYGLHGGNFVKTILRLAKERESLSVVDDQVGAPTSAELLADVTAVCVALTMHRSSNHASGIYQVVPSGHTSWHGYAQFVVETAVRLGIPLKLSAARIETASSAQYASPAKRPLNSRMSNKKLRSAFGLDMPHWTVHVERFLTELAAAELQ